MLKKGVALIFIGLFLFSLVASVGVVGAKKTDEEIDKEIEEIDEGIEDGLDSIDWNKRKIDYWGNGGDTGSSDKEIQENILYHTNQILKNENYIAELKKEKKDLIVEKNRELTVEEKAEAETKGENTAVDKLKGFVGKKDWSYLWKTLLWIGGIIGLIFLIKFFGSFWKWLFPQGPSKKKRLGTWIIVLVIVGVLGFLLFSAAGGNNVPDFFKGLGFELPEKLDSQEVSFKQLFSKGTGDQTLFMTLVKNNSYGQIGKIFASNTLAPVESVFDSTIGPMLGFVSIAELLGVFIHYFIIGFVACLAALFLLGRASELGFISKDLWFAKFFRTPSGNSTSNLEGRNATSTLPLKAKINLGLLFAAIFAALFVIPIFGGFLKVVTLAFLAELMPFPFNYIVKILLFSLVLFVLVFVPSLIKWYADNKKKRKKLEDLEGLESAFQKLNILARSSE